MKQNKDREELFNLCEKYVLDKSQSGAYDLAGYIDEEISELVDFVETHTQKKVKESKTELLEEILEENHCDLDGTYDYDGIAESVIKLCKNK